MDLFSPVVEPKRFHKNFASVLLPYRKAERQLLEEWAREFKNGDRFIYWRKMKLDIKNKSVPVFLAAK
ncbi:MAG: hypothetical protein AB2754_19685 [Candidatus Thiodiazotropha endolucinida]